MNTSLFPHKLLLPVTSLMEIQWGAPKKGWFNHIEEELKNQWLTIDEVKNIGTSCQERKLSWIMYHELWMMDPSKTTNDGFQRHLHLKVGSEMCSLHGVYSSASINVTNFTPDHIVSCPLQWAPRLLLSLNSDTDFVNVMSSLPSSGSQGLEARIVFITFYLTV